MATPHVAGVAALLLENDPSLTPGAIKQALTATAEQRGAPSNVACDPDWNNGWGWGLIDAHAALTGGGGGPTDVGFVPFAGAVFANSRIGTLTPPKVNVPNEIQTTIENFGPNAATNVRVKFKIDYISASNWSFYDVGDVIVPFISSGSQLLVSIAWTPQHSSHQCLKAQIEFAADTNTVNNRAQRNITVAQSPVFFRIDQLTFPGSVTIDFVPTIEPAGSGWAIQFTPPSVTLNGGESATIEAIPIPPPGTPDGEEVTISVSAVHGDCLLGGVVILATMRDCNANAIEDWIDIRDGTSDDTDENGIPDECEGG